MCQQESDKLIWSWLWQDVGHQGLHNPPFFLGALASECLSSCFTVTRLCFIRQKKALRAPVLRRGGLTGASACVWTPAAHTHVSFRFYLWLWCRFSNVTWRQTHLQHRWGAGEGAAQTTRAVPSLCWCLWGGWNQTSSALQAPPANPSDITPLFTFHLTLFIIHTSVPVGNSETQHRPRCGQAQDNTCSQSGFMRSLIPVRVCLPAVCLKAEKCGQEQRAGVVIILAAKDHKLNLKNISRL